MFALIIIIIIIIIIITLYSPSDFRVALTATVSEQFNNTTAQWQANMKATKIDTNKGKLLVVKEKENSIFSKVIQNQLPLCFLFDFRISSECLGRCLLIRNSLN